MFFLNPTTRLLYLDNNSYSKFPAKEISGTCNIKNSVKL